MGKIVTLWSPVGHAGVTTTAIMLANKLAKDQSVCLIDLDLNNADVSLYMDVRDVEHNIDNLFSYIQGHNFTEEIFNMNLIKVENFMFMQGTRRIDKGPSFHVEDLEPIVDMAQKLYDIVIINTYSSIDNAGTFIALKKADKVVMVLEQNVFHFRKYMDKAQLVGTLLTDPLVVVNKFNKSVVLTLDNIKENLNTEANPLPALDGVSVLNSINAQASIFDTFGGTKARKYDENLKTISEHVLVALELKDKDEVAKKKRLFGR